MTAQSITRRPSQRVIDLALDLARVQWLLEADATTDRVRLLSQEQQLVARLAQLQGAQGGLTCSL